MTLGISALFCDDIREEVTGKLIMIGVYTGDLIPSQLPATIPLSLLIHLNGLPKGSHDFVVSVTGPANQNIIEQSGTLDCVVDTSPIVLLFQGFQTLLQSTGELVAKLQVMGTETEVAKLFVSDRRRDTGTNV